MIVGAGVDLPLGERDGLRLLRRGALRALVAAAVGELALGFLFASSSRSGTAFFTFSAVLYFSLGMSLSAGSLKTLPMSALILDVSVD